MILEIWEIGSVLKSMNVKEPSRIINSFSVSETFCLESTSDNESKAVFI